MSEYPEYYKLFPIVNITENVKVTNMPPKPVSPINVAHHYGKPSKLPPLPKIGSMHSAALERIERQQWNDAMAQSRAHAAVYDQNLRNMEVARRERDRIQTMKLQRSFDVLKRGPFG